MLSVDEKFTELQKFSFILYPRVNFNTIKSIAAPITPQNKK